MSGSAALIIETVVAAAGEDVRPRQPASDAVYLAALMLASRLYHRVESPLGIQGGFDFGGLHIRSRDPDITALLKGRRGRKLAANQQWPDVDSVRSRARIGSSVADDEIADVVAAVVDFLRAHIETFGIA